MIGEADTCRDIIPKEIAHIGTYREIIAFPLQIFYNKEIQVTLIMFGIRHGTPGHPCSFRDEHGLLHLSVNALDGTFAALCPRLPCTNDAEKEEAE